MRAALAAAALLLSMQYARAYEFLRGYDTATSVPAALERVRAQPDKHVLLYFGMSEFCPPCREARAILNSDAVRARLRPHYVVVSIDLFAPSAQEREVIDQVRVHWAPVLVFLDGHGRRVAYARQLRSEKDALALAQLVSQRHVRLSPLELRQLLAGKRMRKENQDWFLTLDFGEKNLLEAEGHRKNGRGGMRGAGKWYVTRKGKLCLELTARDVDENWCRHVFFAGGTYYLSKDLRPDRVVYRMVADRG